MDPPAFMGSFRFDSEADMERALRENFTIPFFAAFNLFCLAHKYTIYMVTRRENFDLVRKTGQIPAETVEDAWAMAQAQCAEKGISKPTVNVLPHGGSVIPSLAK